MEIGKLKNELAGINSDVSKLHSEIDRLNKISSQVKSMDFDLVNYAKKLQADDSEKLRLLRQIDSLERLVSKMRRQQK